MKKNLIILLLAILSIGLVGYIVYNEINDKNNTNCSNNILEEDNTQVINYKLEDFVKIINDELEFLVSKENLKDLTNEEKTYMLYNLLNDKNNLTTDKLENIRKNSSLREMEIEYTDIKDSYIGYELVDEIARSLNKETGEYSDYLTGHGGNAIRIYDFLVDFKQEDNKYIISYKYLFYGGFGQGPINLNLYYTYENALNSNDVIKEFKLSDYNDNYSMLVFYLKQYAEENYNSIKDKLNTYNYVFEINDNNIVLTDFYRE